MISEVFVDGLEAKPIICGAVALDAKKRVGRFRYGLSYLNWPDAFALDPINFSQSMRFALKPVEVCKVIAQVKALN